MPAEPMRFAVGISDARSLPDAVDAAVAQVTTPLAGAPVHLALCFVSTRYQGDWPEGRTGAQSGAGCWVPMLRQIREALRDPLLIGCTAGGVLGARQELEGVPALSLVAASLPRVVLHPFTVIPDDLEEDRGAGFWIEKLGATPADAPIGLLLPEPFSCDAMTLVTSLNAAYPKMPLIGGLASGADHAGGNALFFNDQVVTEGAVGVLLTGDITLQTIVSQGCRPIGRSFIVTKAEGNVLLELAGMPATEALRQVFNALSAADKALAQHALFIGVVMHEQRERFERGDFLIRNLVGMDPDAGALAIGDRIQVGQTIQFQLRDAGTARDDLQHLLTANPAALAQPPSAGALLFSCLGRGKDLFGEPHHDIRAIAAAIGTTPIGGFFCNGEIGPVGGRNFIHGFTSSLGLFRPKP